MDDVPGTKAIEVIDYGGVEGEASHGGYEKEDQGWVCWDALFF